MNTQEQTSGNAIRLVVYWLLVGIPLIWGVVHTIANAAKMFH
ncbi:MAG: MFS transporter small subunit [Acetobacteraceae bacterium]